MRVILKAGASLARRPFALAGLATIAVLVATFWSGLISEGTLGILVRMTLLLFFLQFGLDAKRGSPTGSARNGLLLLVVAAFLGVMIGVLLVTN